MNFQGIRCLGKLRLDARVDKKTPLVTYNKCNDSITYVACEKIIKVKNLMKNTNRKLPNLLNIVSHALIGIESTLTRIYVVNYTKTQLPTTLFYCIV